MTREQAVRVLLGAGLQVTELRVEALVGSHLFCCYSTPEMLDAFLDRLPAEDARE